MLLFTMTPALAMMPMPVITTPNGWPMIIRPSSTPMVDSTTADSTRMTEVKRLNCASRIAKIRKIAVPKAFARKAPAFSRSSSSPLSLKVTPSPRSALASAAITSCCTTAFCTPSAILADTVMTRLPLTRLM